MNPCEYRDPDGDKCGLEDPHRHIYDHGPSGGSASWLEPLPEPMFHD